MIFSDSARHKLISILHNTNYMTFKFISVMEKVENISTRFPLNFGGRIIQKYQPTHSIFAGAERPTRALHEGTQHKELRG